MQRAFSLPNLVCLALTYLLYFGQLGVLVPYLGVFLDGRGFSSSQIGELFALITITRILGPNLWAHFADRSGKGLRLMQLGSLITFISFLPIFWLDSFWGLTLGFGLVMMFWTAILPQLEVLTLTCIRGDAVKYSKIRLWGSVGFILFTILGGKMLDVFSSEAPIYLSALVLLGIFLATTTLSAPKTASKQDAGDDTEDRKLLRRRPWILFILSAILLQVSFAPYYSFFALYMRDLGFSGEQTGILVALGVVAEIFIFLLAGRLLQRFGVKWVLIASILLTALRWWLLAYYTDFTSLIVFAQLLHAFGFGLTHAASMDFIHRYFSPAYQSRGQAWYISLAFGLGGASGAYLAGMIWQQGSGAELSFAAAALVAFVSAACLLFVSTRRMTHKPG